jgi:putative hydrolase of the HAD superfamily
MITMDKLVVIFDLDDTLYREIDFLKSAFQEIAHLLSESLEESSETIYDYLFQCYQKGDNAFQSLLNKYPSSNYQVNDLVNLYRQHNPNISLSPVTLDVLTTIKHAVYKVGLITDGRVIQQQHKIEALGLKDYFDGIVISESFGSTKPDMRNFQYYESLFEDATHFIYVGDNTQKDFIAPNALGWTTICLKDKGFNIHLQSFDDHPTKQPHMIIEDFSELPDLIMQILCEL